MVGGVSFRDYTLVICEKPDAARRVAEALAGARVDRLVIRGVEAFEFSRSGQGFVVCSALGHLYEISDPFRSRGVYPVFDLEWFPSNLVDENLGQAGKRISVIKELCVGAKTFVNACDFDVEGETIGSNVLRYACGEKESVALRAKFSTLTKDELVQAMADAEARKGEGLAEAGRTRHFLDFLWGVNFSRILSQSISQGEYRYKTVSIGRVQGPTLGFVVEREIQIKAFVPLPHWTATATFLKDTVRFEAPYIIAKIPTKAAALRIEEECVGNDGIVSEIKTSVFREYPPLPFDTGELQKEAFRAFGFSPSRTLQIAERLYLNALISYPRTNSQKLPPSIDYQRIIANLGRIRDYAFYSAELLKMGDLKPHEGAKIDSAHPAIYPTGEHQGRAMGVWERRLFDLIVRRFLANFAGEAIRKRLAATVVVKGHHFRLAGARTIRAGWMNFYRPYAGFSDNPIPDLNEGDVVKAMAASVQERFGSPPPRYNHASILDKMEKEEIGTKATRAETVETLALRGYVSGSTLTATEIGLSVIEMMKKYCPDIISTGLTRETEKHLERIEIGEEDGEKLVEEMVEKISSRTESIRSNMTRIGSRINQSITTAAFEESILGACPVCGTGKLRVIRNMKTRKRFAGCTNYPDRCRASAPLPQRGILRPAKPCLRCGWPVILLRFGRSPWRLCINTGCPDKKNRRRGLHATQKKR